MKLIFNLFLLNFHDFCVPSHNVFHNKSPCWKHLFTHPTWIFIFYRSFSREMIQFGCEFIIYKFCSSYFWFGLKFLRRVNTLSNWLYIPLVPIRDFVYFILFFLDYIETDGRYYSFTLIELIRCYLYLQSRPLTLSDIRRI